jgi:copper(I)-binding protein
MNHGSESVTLTRISAAGLAVQMHTTVVEDAGTTMRPLTSVTIAADEQTVFQPGGKHLMIRDLPTGVENLALNMEFADGSILQTTFALIPMQQWMEGGQNPHQGH